MRVLRVTLEDLGALLIYAFGSARVLTTNMATSTVVPNGRQLGARPRLTRVTRGGRGRSGLRLGQIGRRLAADRRTSTFLIGFARCVVLLLASLELLSNLFEFYSEGVSACKIDMMM